MPGVIMMGSMFILFVIEMYLNAKTGGHSHGGHDGTGSHSQELDFGPPIDYEKGMPPTKVYEEEVRMEQNFLRVSDIADAPMPAWFVVFYEQYVRERIDMMRMLKTSYPVSEASYDPKQEVTVSTKEIYDQDGNKVDPQVLRKMSLNITLLEGGILFHSVFVGMTISITTDGFIILLAAIMFHQMFEGIGLGARIAAVPYPRASIRPWVLVVAFGTTCPIGQAIGLATRGTYDPESAFGLIMVGAFNAM
jgi:zinc transporter ZupT